MQIEQLAKSNEKALNWLCATALVLLAFPRLNIKLGPIPLYAIDILLFGTYYYSTKLKYYVRPTKDTFGTFVTIILFLAILSELYGLVVNNTYFETVYTIARTSLAFSLFFSTRRIIYSAENLMKVLKFAFVGVTITAILLIISSLPPTKMFAVKYLFSIKYLEPAAANVVKDYSAYAGAMRGHSFVGVSILSASFVNIVWPLLLYLRQHTKSKLWTNLIFVATIVLPASVIFSYSRGAVIGLILVVFGIFVFNSGNYRTAIIMAVTLGVFTFIYIGVDSQYFYFKRLEKSTTRVVDQPIEDRNETERLYSYIEPFWHLEENPHFFLFGEGSIVERAISDRAIIQGNRADHAVFAKSYYMYGMIAAILYSVMLIFGLLYTFNNAVLDRRVYVNSISRTLFATLLGFFPWFVFGHAAVSTPRGAMLTMLIFGVVSIQKSLKPMKLIRARSENQSIE